MQPKGAFSIWVALGIAVALAMGGLLFYKWVPSQPHDSPDTGAVGTVPAQGEGPIENQYAITEADNGKIFAYPVTSRFSVELDSTRFSQVVSCAPDGVVGAISNVPSVPPPLFAVRFEAVAPGTCVLSDGMFSVTIVVEPLEKAPVGPAY